MVAATQTPVITPTIDRLAAPVMPENPTDVDIGRNLYYHNCMPCHGDRGQGLTDEFREVWVEDHQNCWASGCHGGKVDDEGFPIPKHIPAVIGETATFVRFSETEDLVSYLSQEHPPQQPGVLKPEECQALTAFLLVENGRVSPGNEIDPESVTNPTQYLLIVVISISLFLGGLFILIFFTLRKRKKIDLG